jgi:hypothetical protein
MITREFLVNQQKQLQDRSKVLEGQLSELAGALALCEFLLFELDRQEQAGESVGGTAEGPRPISSSPEL